MECWETINGQVVVPIFYNVDPSAIIEFQRGSTAAEASVKLEENFMEEREKMQRWREALTKVATTTYGWVSRGWEETMFIEEIVRDISDKLHYTSSRDTCNLVGMGTHITEMEKILCLESNAVHMVGIWGMGGIGKTTIAKFIYDRICSQFQVHCFLANVKEDFRNLGAAALREKLLCKGLLLERKLLNRWTFNAGFNMIKKRLCHKKVLVVLDDVDDWKQLEIFVNGSAWFGPGSRIIITTRDKHLLEAHGVKNIYQVSYLKNDQALQLFSQYAFKQNNPRMEYLELSERFSFYAKGLPLALKVLGSFLNDKSILEWQTVQDKLTIIPDLRIHDVLRVSFDDLDDTQRDVFLDIACFFNGWDMKIARDILECCGFFPDIALAVLKDRALITTSDDMLLMHDMLQEMGQEIVRQQSKEEPGERSRLWIPEDIYQVLTTERGTRTVEGISLDMSKTRDMHLQPSAFTGMSHLRLLNFYLHDSSTGYKAKVHLPHGLQSLSHQLRYLHWHGFPMKSLPSNFCTEKLVALELPYCRAGQLWTGIQPLVNLKRISLPQSKYLTTIPDLSEAINIESIDLQGCKSLVELPSSIQYLSKLEHLNLRLCKALKNLPCRIDSKFLREFHLTKCYNVNTCPEIFGNLKNLDLSWTAVKELPASIFKLTDLSYLDLTGCSKITKFPEASVFLKYLYLSETAIEEVPQSIQFLTGLVTLKLTNNKKLLSLSSSICKLKCLKTLDLSGCSKFECFPEILEPMEVLATLRVSQTAIKYLPSPIENVKFLETLHLNECKNLVSLPSNIHQLSRLEEIDLTYCKGLLSLPKLPSSLILLKANNCESLENLSSRSKCNFECIHFANCFKLDLKADAHLAIQLIASKFREVGNQSRILFPGIEIPQWFHHQNVGSLVTVQLPSHRHQLKGIAFCIVIALEGSQSLPDIIFPIACWINCDCRVKADNFEGNAVIGSWQCFDIDVHLLESDHVLLWYDPHSETSQTGLMDEKGWFNKYSGHEVSFDFCFQGLPELIHMLHCNIKNCGVRLLYVEANSKPSSMFDSDTEEEESNSKRIKYSND
ncbi:disease resistance protein RUN1-like isoform X1 [Hevea brasiliensis]|uniref:disease resistance protein RUN1-like isoform X1 n=2 Tax=Hevea brasiliensis TaxID=3981 RepID=UPI0025FA0678|nr:disease resistance protein RUN1-like isoform X1 [Hevea brasiliensis]